MQAYYQYGVGLRSAM